MYKLTGLGKVSSWMYFSPGDIYKWYKNFYYLFNGKPISEDFPLNKESNKLPLLDDISISWSLTDVPSNDWGYIPKDIKMEVEDLRWKLRNRDIMASDAIFFSLAAYKCLTGVEIPKGSLSQAARTIRYDIRRICQALSLIDSQYGMWKKGEFWKTLPIRIMYGIPESMLELVSIPGIGGVKAKKMYEKGIKDLKDVVEKTDAMKLIFTPTAVYKIQQEIKRMLI